MRTRWIGALVCTLMLAACASSPPIDLAAESLAQAIARQPVVLLGEVHDNARQHAVRADALRRLMESGARPALAFEQFDRDRQADIDRARREAPPAGRAPAEHVIEQARSTRGDWNWTLYRPFVELALAYDLPIVAANLSRADAMRVAREGYAAVFDDATIDAIRLDALPGEFLREHERAVDDGHCNRMPAASLPELARAQIARDLTLARAIRPHVGRGVVLLTGNGHARNDVGVPFFLADDERRRTVSIGLLERDASSAANILEWRGRFDVAFVTPAQPREDPCAKLPPLR
jgi:uncharacterized iron-regulated protein